MANKQRTQIGFPLQLNLAKDRPHIDTSFRNVDAINGPYLNGMHQPVFVKDLKTEAVFDKQGNKYTAYSSEDDYIITKTDKYGDTKQIGAVSEDAFDLQLLEDVTDDMYGYSCDSYGSNQSWISQNENTINFVLNNSTRYTYPATNARIIEARTKWISNYPVYVVYYESSGFEYILIGTIRNNVWYTLKAASTVSWYEQQIRTNSASLVRTVSVGDVDPCIHIALSNNCLVVSLTAYTGEVIDGYKAYFATYILQNYSSTPGTMQQLGSDITVNSNWLSSSNYISKASDNLDNFKLKTSERVSASTRSVVTKDNKTYYIYNSNATSVTNLTQVNDIPQGFTYTQRQMKQKLLESTAADAEPVEYNVYQFQEYTKTFSITITGDSNGYFYFVDMFSLYNPNRLNDGSLQIPKEQNGAAFVGTMQTYSDYITWEISRAGDTKGSNTMSFTYKYYQGQSEPTVIWYGGTANKHFVINSTSTSDAVWVKSYNRDSVNNINGVNIGGSTTTSLRPYFACQPTICLDDGTWVALFNIIHEGNYGSDGKAPWSSRAYDSTTYRFTLALADKSMSIANNKISWSYGPTSIPIDTDWVVRGVSFCIDQNIVVTTVKLNSNQANSPLELSNGKSETGAAQFIEATYSNTTGLRYGAGTSRKSNWNYYSQEAYNDPAIAGPSEDLLTFTVGGFRTNDERFHLLYNVYNSGYFNNVGISYSQNVTDIGTLLTPWFSIDESAYVTYGSNFVRYKSKNGKWYEINTQGGAYLETILEDRLLIVRTLTGTNCYDTLKDKWYNYAPDWNGRVMFGQSEPLRFRGALPSSSSSYTAYPYIRYTAAGLNPLYETMPRDVIVGMIQPILARYRCGAGAETGYGIGNLTQDIDVFYSDYTDTLCKYRSSLIGNTGRLIKHTLQGLQYPGSTTTSASLSPSYFANYINGAGNNDLVVEGYDSYTLTYYDNEPFLVYSSTTQVSNTYSNKSVFFVLQGQFYGVIGDKLYSMLYNNGAISTMDAIIDLGDLQFIGNNPMISFWYDPSTRVIRSFTGDANMETLYSASKISSFYKSWYDETTQSIYVSTNAGLLVIGPKNLYLFEDWTSVNNCQFSSDGITHVTNNGITYDLVYYAKDGFEVVPLKIETAFYGLGATEVSTIDRWSITLYDIEGTHPNSYINLVVRSLTDVTTRSESRQFRITPDMWDKWSNSVLINYNPKLIKGQGIKLEIETPMIVQAITPHVADQGNSQLSRKMI